MVKFLGLVVLVTLVFTLACQEPTPAPASNSRFNPGDGHSGPPCYCGGVG